MKITIAQPSGIAPKIDPTQLNDTAATVALNCRLDSANLRSLKAPDPVITNWTASTIRSMYRFGENSEESDEYWFRSGNDVNYLKAPFFGDTRELTLMTE